MKQLATTCCIAGGGPAGMMLGYLLARAGIDVVVLEKHADFLRDFRGDTIHPSTLELMHELGLLEMFLKRPHQQLTKLEGIIGETRFVLADFSRVPTVCKFIALMPQWDFLDFIAEQARRYSGFRLLMRAEAKTLLRDAERVTGLRADTPDGPLEVLADLVVGCDGRSSTIRNQAGLAVIDLGATMDVLWMRISRRAGDPTNAFGHIDAGQMFVMIDRGDYWQCALVVAKGSFDAVRARGLQALREIVLRMSPWLAERGAELASWDDVKLLTVTIDRLREWSRPGLLCIGDAAHAMSPVGGVGINLAVQDAVAAANILAEPLRRRAADASVLRRVQARRAWPTRATQWLQVVIQRRVIGAALAGTQTPRPPLLLRLFAHWPRLRGIPARLVGVGLRPEHVRTPERGARST